jgi:hypothetical protein
MSYRYGSVHGIVAQVDQGYPEEVQDPRGGGEREGRPGGAGQPRGRQRKGKSQTQGSLHPVGDRQLPVTCIENLVVASGKGNPKLKDLYIL